MWPKEVAPKNLPKKFELLLSTGDPLDSDRKNVQFFSDFSCSQFKVPQRCFKPHRLNNSNFKTCTYCNRLRKGNESVTDSVTRLGDLLEFGQLFEAFGNN